MLNIASHEMCSLHEKSFVIYNSCNHSAYNQDYKPRQKCQKRAAQVKQDVVTSIYSMLTFLLGAWEKVVQATGVA